MRAIFELPMDYNVAIDNITGQCGELCERDVKKNLNGDQVITISAVLAPAVWELIDKYLSDNRMTIEIKLDDLTTITIAERSIPRAKQKVEAIKAKWENEKTS